MTQIRICCPKCRTPVEDAELGSPLTGELVQDKSCPHCGFRYQVRDGITDFAPEDHFYWGEISQERMEEINRRAEQTGWFQALSGCVESISNRDLTYYLFDRVRIAGLVHYYNPERKEAALDLGSGWGPIAFGLSEFYDTVYSMDGVYERMRYQAIRARQDRVSNIRILKGNLLRLPLSDDSMDTIVVNGVLEWVGLSDRMADPQQLQNQFLSEVYRVLKPGGRLYIGIENRFGAQYLLGGRDHSGLRFTSLMPRWMANGVMKLFGQQVSEGGEDFSFSDMGASYRTLTHSIPGYRKLLRQAGFARPRIHWTRADYNYPWVSGTLDGNSLKLYLEYFASQASGPDQTLDRWIARLPKSILGFLVQLFSTDLLIVASKEESIDGLEEQIARTPPQGSFLRTTLETRANLNTTYWFLNGHGVGRIAQLRPISQEGTRALAVETLDLPGGHPLRPNVLGEVRRVARWLADFQAKNQSGLWPTEQPQAEMHELVERAKQFAQDRDLEALLEEYDRQYQKEIATCAVPVVVEHGDLAPSNIIIIPNDTIRPIHWEHSKKSGNPMMDIGALYLAMLTEINAGDDNTADVLRQVRAIQESYRVPFEIPWHLSPGYFALRSLAREMGDAELGPENYMSWKYWMHLLPITLRYRYTGEVK